MTDEQIKAEFNRWINEGRPQTWYKKNDEWTVLYTDPKWLKDGIYIVDDEYAEIRKSFYDGKTIQYYEESSGRWFVAASPSWTLPVDEYRIKPEKPVYEYQWYYIDSVTNVFLTSGHYVDIEETEKETKILNVDWKPFEPSKRVRK